MVAIKVCIVVAVIVFGLSYVHARNLEPFIPPNQGQFGKFGITGILAASSIAFFAYIGFEAVSVAAQEARNPRRDLPIGILGSLGICTALYMLMALVLTGITDWRTLDVTSPVSFAVSKIEGLKWLVIPIDIGAVVGLASVVFISLYGQSRVFYSMARDGFLPPAFSSVHRTFKTPHRGTIIIGIFAAALAAVFPFDVLADLVSIGTLAAFIAVCVGIRSTVLGTQERQTISHALRLVFSSCRHYYLRRHDAQPGLGHLGPADNLDGDRACLSSSPTASSTRHHPSGRSKMKADGYCDLTLPNPISHYRVCRAGKSR